jgi:hypothetical protein
MQVQLVMADDDATPSNPPVAPVQQKELEEAPLDLNVSQWPREEEPPRRVVHTRVDRSVWDRRLSPNPHALAIYVEFVPAHGTMPERFEECQCEDDDVRFHCRTWVPGDGHYRWLPTFPGASSRVPRSHHSPHPRFFTTMIYPLSQLFSCNSLEATQAEMLILKLDFDCI